jgi:CO dehydrogenase maturation factor
MKIAITGKGGSGKTTLSAMMALILNEKGYNVLAIDCDPDNNLLSCFDESRKIESIAEMKELILERTKADGGFFKLNPFVRDLPEKYFVEINGIKLIQIGKSQVDKIGCYCVENAFIKSLISYLILETTEAVVLDMEAGIEHLTRGVAGGVDILLIVTEPESKSVQSAQKIYAYAKKLGIKQISFIGNKVVGQDDIAYIGQSVNSPLAGAIPFSEAMKLSRGLNNESYLDLKKHLETIFETRSSNRHEYENR